MRELALLAVVVLVASGLPAVDAKHLSVGWSDNLGLQPEENASAPTVTEQDYNVGTSSDCYEPDSDNRSLGEIEEARASDSFCGTLIYEQGTHFENVADRDQQLNGPIGSFDVVRAGKPTLRFNTCYPWCSSNAAGQTAFDAFHSVGEELELTDSPGEASNKDGDHTQSYVISPAYPTAGQVVQEQAGVWRMNGWYHPQPVYETFVGFLHDEGGEPIGDDRLQAIVDENRDRFSKDRAIESGICGFTPNDFFIDTGVIGVSYRPSTDGWCPVAFEWVESSETQTDFKDGYDDRCRSPTYVCGVAQPAWQATVLCPEWDACTNSGTSSKDVEYSIWHWVVGPTRSACNGQQAPGVDFETKAEWDYLAHDLDVWTPVTSLNQQDTEGVAHLHEYATGIPAETREEAGQAVRENITTLFEEVNRLLETPAEVGDVSKDSRVEPNYALDDLASMGLTEDSQSKSWAREEPSGGATCSFFESFFYGAEDYIDPWVNIVDMDTVQKGVAGTFSTGFSGTAWYGNTAEHQDRVNQPTAGSVFFGGQIGVFTDKADDGHYGSIGPSPIEEGAYSLFWDMHLDETGAVDPKAGCSLDDGTALVEAMQRAKYGPHTGLVLATYLEEPTVAHDSSTLESIPFPAGQTILVQESQAITQLRKLDDPRVTEWLDRIVEGLRSHPDIADDADVVYLNDEFERSTSFEPECNGGWFLGEFESRLSLVHQCETGCAGDTIVTGYMVESTHPDLQIGSEQGTIPPLEFDSGEVFGLEESIETWLDVDPFDGDPDRNRENSSAPPH